MRLVLQGVAVELGGCPIVAEADLVVETGEFVGLVGPNGLQSADACTSQTHLIW